MRHPLLLVVAALAIVGCGNGDESSISDEEAIIETIDLANESFAEGDFSRTCSYYSAEIQVQLAREAQVKTCPEAWAAMDAILRESLSPAEFDALTSFGVDSVEVTGDTATARYGEPPVPIGGLLGISAGTVAELQRDGDEWRISKLPGS